MSETNSGEKKNENKEKTPRENNPLKSEIEEGEKKEEIKKEKSDKKNSLLFDQKDISPMKLYCHLSEKLEIIFMIIGVIGSIGAGSSGPIISLLNGSTINNFRDSTIEINTANKEDIMQMFKDEIDKKVRIYFYMGILMFFLNFLMTFMWALSALRQMHHLKEKYFATILKQEQGWFDENNAYEFSTKVQAQLEQIELGVGDKFGVIVQLTAQLIAGLIISFITSWKLTLVMLCVTPITIFSFVYMMKTLKTSIILARKTYEKAGGVAEEILYNIKTVSSFVNFDFEINRFGSLIDEVHIYNVDKAYKLGRSVGIAIAFSHSSFAIAILYGKKLIIDKEKSSRTGDPFTVGDILIAVYSTLIAIMSISNISPNVKIIQESALASSDYFTLYERKPKINLSESTLKPPKESIKGKVEFQNISFIYPSDKNKRKILDGLNLTFEPGKKVALVGESGCGKSTTVNLIERLYEPTEGTILIDGIEIQKYDLEYLRSFIGYVQQEPVLFNQTIMDNIIFGRKDLVKELGDPETLVKNACKDSNATEFIEKSPEKYNYIVGIKGSKLSGGQKQRIAIARAILCQPKILILDEATSALDNKSEKEVQAALDEKTKKNITTIIIAHRLSTIKNADVIYALKNGQVCEMGTHEELLEKNGYYAGLVKSQLTEDDNKKKFFEKKLSHKLSSRLSKKLSLDYSDDIKTQLSDDSNEDDAPIEYGRLFRLLKNNKCDTIIGITASLCGGVIAVFSGWVLAKAINGISGTDNSVIKKEGNKWGGIFFCVAMSFGFIIFWKLLKLDTIGSIISSNMRKEIVKKYLELHVGFYDLDENSPGALLTRLSIDTTQLNAVVLTIVGDVVTTTGTLIFAIGLSCHYDYRLTLISLCFQPFIVAAQILVNRARRGGRDGEKKMDIEAGAVLSECVINTKTIYSFNFQGPAVEMYLNILKAEKKNFLRDSLFQGILLGIGIFCSFACNATVFNYAGYYVRKGSLSYKNMIFVINICSTMSTGLSNGLRGIADFSKAKKSCSSVFRILNTKSEINAFENVNEGKKLANDLKGKIEFKNVSFCYPTKPNQKVLNDVSFTIEPGQSAALVGYSGCGKSTIIQLLERFYDVTEGQILLDGIDIKDYNLFDLRKKIGLVSQEPVLFKRNVYENIRYGNLNATRDEVFNSAKRAKIEKFFTKEELGTKEDPVSGGEKQRLAIARAFLKNPVILLLDEATSALDKESEIEVQKSIKELQEGRTSIAVAHRLSTIVDSDIIFVIEAGKIVEKGKHEELLSLGKKYATLYKYSNSN